MYFLSSFREAVAKVCLDVDVISYDSDALDSGGGVSTSIVNVDGGPSAGIVIGSVDIILCNYGSPGQNPVGEKESPRAESKDEERRKHQPAFDGLNWRLTEQVAMTPCGFLAVCVLIVEELCTQCLSWLWFYLLSHVHTQSHSFSQTRFAQKSLYCLPSNIFTLFQFEPPVEQEQGKHARNRPRNIVRAR